MADVSKTVEIVFGGKDTGLGASVDSIASKLGTLNSAVSSAAEPLANIADWVMKADTALAALAAGGLALAVKESASFQSSFNEISTVSSATGSAVGEFKDKILEYASGSTQSLENINKSVYSAISAGVDYKDSLELLTTAEKLSVGGKADLEKSTLLLISTLNAYGESTDKASKYSDIFFKTVELGQTTIPELASSMSQVTGIAATANVPIETLTAAIAALTATGLPTSQAVSGLKEAFSNIIKPAAAASEEATKLGVEFGASAVKTKGFEGVLWDVYKATGGNVDQMAKFFGSTEALNAVMILGADKAGKFKEALDSNRTSAGATTEAFDKMKDNVDLALTNLQNNFKTTFIKIGDEIIPAFSKDVSGLSSVFKGVQFALDQGSFDPLFEALNSAGIELSRLLDGMAKAFPEAMRQVDFAPLVEALKSLGVSIGDLFSNFDPSDPEQLAKAIQWVTDTIESLILVTKGMVDEFKPFFDGILNSITGFNKMDTASKESAGNILAAAKGVKEAGILIIAALGTIGQNADTMKGVFEAAIGAIGFMWDSSQATFDAIVVSTLTLFEKLVSAADLISFGAFTEELGGAKKQLEAWRMGWEDAFIRNANEARGNIQSFGKGIDELAGVSRKASGEVQVLGESIELVPDEKKTDVTLTADEALKKVHEVTTKLGEVPAEKSTTVTAKADDNSITGTAQKIAKMIPDEKGTLVWVGDKPGSIEETKKKIDENLPAEKRMEIQAQVDIESIKAQAAVIQETLKWKAEVDIAQIQAAAATTQKAFESVNITLSTGEKILGDMFSLWKDADYWGRQSIEGWINQELSIRQQAVDQQKILVQSMSKYYEAKANALSQGKVQTLELKAENVQPHIEAFMWEVVKALQVRVNEEASEFLIGIGGA